MKKYQHVAASAAAVLLGATLITGAYAQTAPGAQPGKRILPLPQVVERALVDYPGQLLEAEREQEDGRMAYELEIADEDGLRRKLYYDVFTGELLKVKEEHNDVYDMRRAGDILPLSEIVKRAQEAHPGELLEADLDEERGTHIYELKMASDDGLHRELHIDAVTGELLKTEFDD